MYQLCAQGVTEVRVVNCLDSWVMQRHRRLRASASHMHHIAFLFCCNCRSPPVPHTSPGEPWGT